MVPESIWIRGLQEMSRLLNAGADAMEGGRKAIWLLDRSTTCSKYRNEGNRGYLESERLAEIGHRLDGIGVGSEMSQSRQLGDGGGYGRDVVAADVEVLQEGEAVQRAATMSPSSL